MQTLKILWDKISQKTTYSVEFKTEKLIELAADKNQENGGNKGQSRLR